MEPVSDEDWRVPTNRLVQIARFEMKQRIAETSNSGRITAAKYPRDFKNIRTKKRLSPHLCKLRCDLIIKTYLDDRRRRLEVGETLSDTVYASDNSDVEYTDDESSQHKRNFDYGPDVLRDLTLILRKHAAEESDVHWQMITSYIKILCVIHGKRALLSTADGGMYVGKAGKQSTTAESSNNRFGHSHVRRLINRLRLPKHFVDTKSFPVVPFDINLLNERYPSSSINYAETEGATVQEAIEYMNSRQETNVNAHSNFHNSSGISDSSGFMNLLARAAEDNLKDRRVTRKRTSSALTT